MCCKKANKALFFKKQNLKAGLERESWVWSSVCKGCLLNLYSLFAFFVWARSNPEFSSEYELWHHYYYRWTLHSLSSLTSSPVFWMAITYLHREEVFAETFAYQDGLLRWHSSKESKEFSCQAGDVDSILGSGRFPEGGDGYQTQYSCLET